MVPRAVLGRGCPACELGYLTEYSSTKIGCRKLFSIFWRPAFVIIGSEEVLEGDGGGAGLSGESVGDAAPVAEGDRLSTIDGGSQSSLSSRITLPSSILGSSSDPE